MSNLRLVPINVFDDAVLSSLTGAFSTSLPLGFMQLVARDRVAQSTSTGDQVIAGHWNGNGKRLDTFRLFRQNGAGGRIRVQLYNNALFGSDGASPVYDSGVLSIYTVAAIDSGEWGWAPLGVPSNDVLALEAPFALDLPSAFVCSSFKITLSRCQGPYWAIGRLFGGKYIEAPYSPKFGMRVGWKSNTTQTRTKGASLRTRPAGRWRELVIDMMYATDADRAIWRDLMGQISLEEDVAISVFPGVGGRQERDHIFNAQLQEHGAFNWANVNFNQASFTFQEI